MSPIQRPDHGTEAIRQGAAQKNQRDGKYSLQEKQEEPGNRPGTGGRPDQPEGIRDKRELSFGSLQFFVQRRSVVMLEKELYLEFSGARSGAGHSHAAWTNDKQAIWERCIPKPACDE